MINTAGLRAALGRGALGWCFGLQGSRAPPRPTAAPARSGRGRRAGAAGRRAGPRCRTRCTPSPWSGPGPASGPAPSPRQNWPGKQPCQASHCLTVQRVQAAAGEAGARVRQAAAGPDRPASQGQDRQEGFALGAAGQTFLPLEGEVHHPHPRVSPDI